MAKDLRPFQFAPAPGDEFQNGDIVDNRVGIWKLDHGRDPTMGRGTAGAFDRFLMLFTGFAQLDTGVDKTWSQAFAGAVDLPINRRSPGLE